MRIDVEFSSLGATLRGWLFQPEVELAPAVIMAHGFSATCSMAIDKYAEAFYAAGFAVLLYDHRGFGASDGDPPRQVNPWAQTRGYLDAVAFLSKLDGIDPDRIAVWGDSLSAGAACVAAAIDGRIGAAVAQVPAFGPNEPPADPDGNLFESLRSMVLSPDVLGFGGPVQGPLPARIGRSGSSTVCLEAADRISLVCRIWRQTRQQLGQRRHALARRLAARGLRTASQATGVDAGFATRRNGARKSASRPGSFRFSSWAEGMVRNRRRTFRAALSSRRTVLGISGSSAGFPSAMG